MTYSAKINFEFSKCYDETLDFTTSIYLVSLVRVESSFHWFRLGAKTEQKYQKMIQEQTDIARSRDDHFSSEDTSEMPNMKSSLLAYTGDKPPAFMSTWVSFPLFIMGLSIIYLVYFYGCTGSYK